MFGIKTKILRAIRNKYTKNFLNTEKIQDLMLAFRADEYGHECNVEKADLGYGWIHYGLIRQQKPKRVLCVGSRHGYIPAVIGQACQDNGFGTVDFVDAGYDQDQKGAWTGVGYWKTKEGREIFNSFGLGATVTLHVMTTKDFAKKYPNITYDYIYIDGDHSYKGVVDDCIYFLPRLSKGGYLSFHDISVKGKRPDGIYGVWKVWSKLISDFKGIEIQYVGSGLGIIQK